MSLAISAATPPDVPLLYELVCELADYEKLRTELQSTPQDIADALFGKAPRVFAEVARWNGEPAGFTLWFFTYSTFRGRHGLYLEDLFVRPAFRGRGIGRALMSRLAQRCAREGYARFEWSVLDWNEPAIAFYKSLGAQIKDEWKICRLDGAALSAFAEAGR